jgi:uncharacterized membrane protein (UPF0127 family)
MFTSIFISMIISIKNKKFNVKTVLTEKDMQKGMMGKDFDSTFNGMLFIREMGQHCFWMKNCIIPLDIIFIDGNTITSIHHNCPPCTTNHCENYCGDGDMVLELKGGTSKELGLLEGDEIIF